MAEIRIRVGASLDRDALNVFKPMVSAARDAEHAVQREQAQARASTGAARKKDVSDAVSAARAKARAESQALREGSAEAKAVFRSRAQAEAKAARESTRIAKEAEREKARDAKDAEKERVKAARESAREIEKIQRETARSIAKMGPGEGYVSTFGKSRSSVQQGALGQSATSTIRAGVGRGAGAVAGAALGFGRRMAGEIAQGYGVDYDVGSQIAKSVSLESSAADITNSGYIAGDERNGTRVAAGDIVSQSRGVAARNGNEQRSKQVTPGEAGQHPPADVDHEQRDGGIEHPRCP